MANLEIVGIFLRVYLFSDDSTGVPGERLEDLPPCRTVTKSTTVRLLAAIPQGPDGRFLPVEFPSESVLYEK